MVKGKRYSSGALDTFTPVLLLFLGPLLVILYLVYPQIYLLKHGAVIALGLFAAWRYGWMSLNYVRALLYAKIYYPRLKRRIAALPPERRYPKHIFFLIPSYGEESWVTKSVFQALFREILQIPSRVTIVVATGSADEDRTIRECLQAQWPRSSVELVFQHQKEGKRIAMGHGLRSIARRFHRDLFHDPDSVTIFMDGDSYMPNGFLEGLLPFFTIDPDIGAVTTNEMAYIDSKNRWYKDWFHLKFGQRHVQFQAHSLSQKVLTLTGRLSAYRTSIVVEEPFIRQLEQDIIVHPIHGKFRFLMGDDKSTWYYLLKTGWKMLYLPDLLCISLESRDGNFLELSRTLPYRWFGNTLRNNGRALALGPLKTGWYIWYVLLEQRIIMWTALVGIVSALLLSFAVSPYYLLFFFVWVIWVRLLQLFVIALSGHRVTWRMVPLMLYTQWIGALVKIRAYYNLSDQKWSKNRERQVSDTMRRHIDHPLVPLLPKVAMFSGIAMFMTLLLASHGFFSIPDTWRIGATTLLREAGPADLHASEMARHQGTLHIDLMKEGVCPHNRDNSEIINRLLRQSDPSKRVVMEFGEGRYDLYTPIEISRDNVVLRGKSPSATRLVSHLKGRESAVIRVVGKRLKRIGYLAQNLYENQSTLFVTKPPESIRYLLIRQPNDSNFLRRLGSQKWQRRYPYLRQEIVEVIDSDSSKGKLYIKLPVKTDFAAGKTELIMLDMRKGVSIESMTIEQLTVDGKRRPNPHDYHNSAPEIAIDAIELQYAADVRLHDLRLLESGRHAVACDYVYGVLMEKLEVDGSWNKGKKGNGYLKLARTYHSALHDSVVRNIRHLTLQWSSTGNHLYNLHLGVDLNLHGGYVHDNRIDHIDFAIPKEHPWRGIVETPPDAAWAPPDGTNRIDWGTIVPTEQNGSKLKE